jgi:hypothetical protein
MTSQTQSQSSRPANPKVMTWIGWGLTLLSTAGLTFSAVMKFMKPDELVKEFQKFGWPSELAFGLGIIEVVSTVLYVIPQTSVLGAILLTGYLGGAVATHVRISDDYFGPIILGVLVWGGLFLRDPRIRALLPIKW